MNTLKVIFFVYLYWTLVDDLLTKLHYPKNVFNLTIPTLLILCVVEIAGDIFLFTDLVKFS